MLQVTAVQSPETGNAFPVSTQLLTELSRVIHAREELRFDYGHDSTGPAERPRRTQPHHLVTWHGRWYLIAWDVDRDDWRTFRVDRLRPRGPSGPRFTPRDLPGADVAAFVTGRFPGTDGSTTDFPCRGEVILGLPRRLWPPSRQDGIVEALGPDRCRLSLGSWSWTGLAATVGRFDTDIQVIGPRELIGAFAELAARYANAAGTARPAPEAESSR